MKGKELMVRERWQMWPVAQADNDNQGLARWVAWPPPPPRHTLMRLKFMALSSRIGSAFGVKLKNQVLSSSFGPTKMGCRIILAILD
jgi:hypothetical protein